MRKKANMTIPAFIRHCIMVDFSAKERNRAWLVHIHQQMWNCLYIERKTIVAVNKTEKISITVTPGQKERWEEWANRKEMPLASFCRYCINAHIEAMERYIQRYKQKNS